MPRSYSRHELLQLRESPLVCKPANLPPVEEWMGPIPDQNQVHNQSQRRTTNKGRNEEFSTDDYTPSRRPPFESRAKSTNVPEDIILGPPNTAFASASGTRNATKAFESPYRSSSINQDDPSAKNDRVVTRERHSKDGQRNAEQTRDQRTVPNPNRRSVKDDSDLWLHVRQPKPSGPDDGERPYRRKGDRGHDRDGQGDLENRPLRGFENHRRDRDADTDNENGARRTGVNRGRNEPSWYRDEAQMETAGLENQENTRSREWRDKDRRATRGSDRDWARGAKADLDPEWMEAPESENVNGTHTQEDFERWKERMKSGKAAKPDTTEAQRMNHDRTTSGAGSGAAKVKVDTPLVVDSSVDGFFGLWNQPKQKEAINDSVDGAQQGARIVGAQGPKSSKFTGFFNPKPDPEMEKEKPSLPMFAKVTDSSSEDKEGFQRILNLLGQQQQPQNGTTETTPRAQQQRDTTASPPMQAPRGVENNDLYSLLGSRSPTANDSPKGKDSEFLLKLMQQPQQQRPDINQSNINSRRANQDASPGLLPLSSLMISPHDTPQQMPSTQPPPGFFDDVPARDKLNPNAERKGPPPGFFDTNFSRQPPAGTPQQSPFSIGLQRPPGLDQVPTGYPQHVQPPRQSMVPPPGFQAPTRGQNAFPPGLIPNDRLQFGMPANGRSMPPPGFMHAAPPGFPVPFGQEGMPYGAFGEGGNFGHAFPPGQQRR